MLLNGNNTGFTGTVNLNPADAGHAFRIGHANALGSTTASLNINAGISIDNVSGADMTLGGAVAQNWNADFSYVGATNSLNLGAGAVALGASRQVTVSANTLIVGGAISDGGNAYGLTKTGTGTLTLSGASTYSGTTTVSAGTLLVNGALGSGPVSVADGATLGGSGTIGGVVTVNAGGTLAPGTSIGALTLNSSPALTEQSLGLTTMWILLRCASNAARWTETGS